MGDEATTSRKKATCPVAVVDRYGVEQVVKVGRAAVVG
jgi:hypothetical protein